MVTLQSAENALKSVYLSAVTELLNTKANPLLSKIEQSSSDVWGKEIRKAVAYGINGGIGAGDEDSLLPAAHGNNYLQFVTTLKNLYGQIEISDKAIRASEDAKGSFVDLLNAELQGLLAASRFNLGRMLYGNGSGELARVVSGSGNTYVLSNTNNLIEGIVVDAWNSLGNTRLMSNLRIRHVNRDTNAITLEATPAGTILAGSILFVQGSKDKEITGIGSLFSSNATLYGVNRSTHPFLNPYDKAVDGSLDEIIMQETIDRLEHSAGSTVDFIACSADVKYAFQEYMTQFRRNIDIMELEGGFKTLSFNGIPLVHDRFIEDGTMYMLNTKAFTLHQLCDWRFLENENGRILRQMQGRPVYTATLVKYCDLICSQPNGQARLTGITR